MLLIASAVPVLLMVRESPNVQTTPRRRAARSSPGTRVTNWLLAVIVSALLLAQFGFALAQQVMALKLLYLDPRTATTATGVCFGVTGVAVAVGSVIYARVGALIGLRRFAIAACCLSVVALIGTSFVGSAYASILCMAIFGFGYGILNPALWSMIGFATPIAYQAIIFGISGSALEAGFGFGPFVGGAVTAAASVSVAFLLAALAATLTAVLIFLSGSEWVRVARDLSRAGDEVV
jgi:MFS family permease